MNDFYYFEESWNEEPGKTKNREPILGIGRNDYGGKVTENGKDKPFYRSWRKIIELCVYDDCSICEEWKSLYNYKKWFDEHYIEDACINKTLFKRGNKTYSPQMCCFIPREITRFLKGKSLYKKYPVGVSMRETIKGERKYSTSIQINGKMRFLGVYSTYLEAFSVYKKHKEAHARVLAEEYKDIIEPRVYDALMNYTININD